MKQFILLFNEKSREYWMKTICDAYPNMVLGKTLTIIKLKKNAISFCTAHHTCPRVSKIWSTHNFLQHVGVTEKKIWTDKIKNI